jgi:hypothetical protein
MIQEIGDAKRGKNDMYNKKDPSGSPIKLNIPNNNSPQNDVKIILGNVELH